MAVSEDNKAAARGFFDVATHGDLDALDAFVSPDYVLHDPTSPGVEGLDGARDLVAMAARCWAA